VLVGEAAKLIVTSSVLGVHEPLVTIHLTLYETPSEPTNCDVGLVGVIIAPPLPLNIVHIPLPMTGAVALRFVVIPTQITWSVPASAVEGLASSLMST
jgi:hypothetical protein